MSWEWYMCVWIDTVTSALLGSSAFIPLRIGDENEKKCWNSLLQ